MSEQSEIVASGRSSWPDLASGRSSWPDLASGRSSWPDLASGRSLGPACSFPRWPRRVCGRRWRRSMAKYRQLEATFGRPTTSLLLHHLLQRPPAPLHFFASTVHLLLHRCISGGGAGEIWPLIPPRTRDLAADSTARSRSGCGLHRAPKIRPFLALGHTGPFTNLWVVSCQPMGLSSGPGTACSLGPGQPEPARHRAVLCSCRAKKTGFVLCRRASSCMDIYIYGCQRTLSFVLFLLR